ncbi:hypothetical protein [Coprothermobacter platensis]|uniref:hypothetical protein n=1 Tax=Coprothermobacter platensis TaxID=108819 RepID=UPI000379B962|nr:hypothetical protein [Coprothermobacter platensis]
MGRNDFKRKIALTNGLSVLYIAPLASMKSATYFGIVVWTVSILCMVYSDFLSARDDTGVLTPETKEYKLIANGSLLMMFFLAVSLVAVLLSLYVNSKRFMSPLDILGFSRNCCVSGTVVTIMFNIFALSLLYRENVKALGWLFCICATIGFIMVLFSDNLIAYSAFMVLIVFLDVVYGRYKVKA